jgi:hypothetical protein
MVGDKRLIYISCKGSAHEFDVQLRAAKPNQRMCWGDERQHAGHGEVHDTTFGSTGSDQRGRRARVVNTT